METRLGTTAALDTPRVIVLVVGESGQGYGEGAQRGWSYTAEPLRRLAGKEGPGGGESAGGYAMWRIPVRLVERGPAVRLGKGLCSIQEIGEAGGALGPLATSP